MSAYPIFFHRLFVAALDRNTRLNQFPGNRPEIAARCQKARLYVATLAEPPSPVSVESLPPAAISANRPPSLPPFSP